MVDEATGVAGYRLHKNNEGNFLVDKLYQTLGKIGTQKCKECVRRNVKGAKMA